MHQLGIALHNYSDAHKKFPPGTIGRDPINPANYLAKRTPFIRSMLDFLEQGNRGKLYDDNVNWHLQPSANWPAFRPTGKSEFDIDQNKKVSIEEQFLPKQFNSSSTLEAEVVVGKPNSFDFDLKPGKKALIEHFYPGMVGDDSKVF